VVPVRGSVVDVRFEADLPPIHSLLRAKDGKTAIEVLIELDAHHLQASEASSSPATAPKNAVRFEMETVAPMTI
jgi:F-type H+-transporting ATPase subunit beta